ncbi:cytochrome P450 2D15-like [Thalassophryne amazonica]|uniref:cytochrome P450 2D15-like n=1 Tax=Thalassophryne amazonica TaxID=390379 RepID=UPI001471CA6E|nr:cytochrome P450 2D15-like [Thalassophryne amazonica]
MLASVTLVFLVILLLFLCHTPRPKNFPPGPRPIPIFGSFVRLNLERPIEDLERLAKQYGNIFSMYIGSRPGVVLNGTKVIKEALITKAADCSDRTLDLLYKQILQVKPHASAVLQSDFNSSWKEQRRFGLMVLRNLGLGKQAMEQRILRETSLIIKELEKSIGKATYHSKVFHNAACSIMSQVLFGIQHSHDDPFAKHYIELFAQLSKIINGPWGMIYDSVPWVRHLPLPFQRAFKSIRESHKMYEKLIAESEKTRVHGKPRHFIDCYLDELDKRGNDGSSFSKDQLCAMLMDLHFAGTDTTSNTLLFALLYLMNHPEIQERCQQEIDMVLEGRDQVTYEDRHKMPYTQAVIHEVQRIANIAPLSVVRRIRNDMELMGYSIPKGTLIIVNLSSVLFEEGQWKSTHEFNPENFLNEKGEFFKPEAFMPFSIGPRICMGEPMARLEMFLILVTVLRKFQFIWPEDAGQPNYIPTFGTIQAPKPFSMVVQLRNKS